MNLKIADKYLLAHQNLFSKLDLEDFDQAIEIISSVYKSGKKIITCGNGGSANTASHYITDWNKMVPLATGEKFRGVSLCDPIGLITAYANDISYEDVFSGQIDGLMDEGDLLIAISGSGNSLNVINAIEAARRAKGVVLGVVGYDGGKILPMCDHSVWIKSFDMQLCEDMHLMFGHMVSKSLCGYPIK